MQLTQLQIRNSLTRRLLTLAACTALAVATGASAVALHVNASAASIHSKQASSQPIQISRSVMSGNRISGENPKYPSAAKKKHIQGTVILAAVISQEGTIKDLEVISGPSALRESALKAVLTWRYKPYILNGSPVAVKTQINIVYSLGDNRTGHTVAKLQSPDFWKQIGETQQAAALNSVEMQRLLNQTQKRAATANKRIDNLGSREQIQKALHTATQQVDTAKFQTMMKEVLSAHYNAKIQQQMAETQKMLATTDARIDNPASREQIQKALRTATQQVDTAKFQAMMKGVLSAHYNAKIQRQMAEALRKQTSSQTAPIQP